jgi:hypothetical protein
VIPRDAKQAIANVLGVDVNILETFVVHGEGENPDIFLVEVSRPFFVGIIRRDMA